MFGLLLILLISFFMRGDKSVAAASISKTSGNNLYTNATTNCWQVASSPSLGPSDVFLGVAEVSSSDVWAVGYHYGNPNATLVEHWDGSAWSIVPSPNVGTESNELNGVAAVGHNDVWAVGIADRMLIEHWDGSAWSVVPDPNVEGYLNGVAAGASNNVWAVGYYTNGLTLIEHWNGRVWSVVSSPSIGTHDNELNGVTVLSGNDIWAVGYYSDSTDIYHTLIEHWNGSRWSLVASPDVGTDGEALNGVAAVSSTNVWAVGYSFTGSVKGETLIEHWDGSRWSIVTSPNVAQHSYLNSIAAISSTDVWAVGVSYFLFRPPDDSVPNAG